MQSITPEQFKFLSDEQKDIYLTALAQVKAQEERSQKLRSFAQGATLGFADEVEAAVKALIGDKAYSDNVTEIRNKIKRYQTDAPIESVAYEVAGAIAPALLTRGATAPLTATQIAGRAGAEGLLSGYGTSEGDILQQATQAVTGGGLGAVTGTAVSYGMKGLGVIADKLVDSMRRLTGGRGATVVENEILRLAEQSGETPDEIVARIARGEIMADNKSLQMALRDLMAKGGLSESDIRRVLPERAESLRLESQAALKQGLSPESGDNVLAYATMKDDAFQSAMNDAYRRVFSSAPPVPQIAGTLKEALIRLPNAKQVLDDVYKTQGGIVPFYKVGDDGSISIVREPTLEDAEIVRRVVSEATGTAYREGRGTVGENLKMLETSLRQQIDSASPELSSVRSQYRKMNALRDAFADGRKAFNKPAEQLELDFAALDSDEAIAAFREGVMAQINDKLTRVGGKQLMRKLADTSTLEGRLFDTVFPEELKRQALNKILTSSRAQSTYEKVIEGSTTYLGQQAGKQSNRGIAMEEMLGAARGSVVDAARIGGKIVQSLAPDLTDAQRKQVTDILISTDPDLVRKALVDESAMARLQNQIKLMSLKLQATARGAGAISGGTAGAYTSGQFFGDDQ